MESSEGTKTAEERSARLSLRKKLLFVLIINLLLFGLIETGVRVGAYFVYGGSPYFLLYGLRSEGGDVDPDGHSVVLDGYNKFPPDRTLRQYGMFEDPTPVRINQAGLRGADFSPEKPEGTVRIVALGGSSTFGFYSRDEHTYPARLDRAFAERACPRPPVEVINAGVPHAKSHNLAAMLRGEVVDYEPDVILIYTGYNDAVVVHEANLAQKTVRWLHEHVVSFVALKMALTKLGVQNLSRAQWARHRAGAPSEYVSRQVELHVESFDRNLREIADTAEEHGIRSLFIKQPIAVLESAADRTYAERLAEAT
ncbi:MAG: GDSL-type esterase/lipase family protein, partial [Gemmatimonadota bacterium]|nr:GDSL-type esterase/lipase family protein [Gemmatimonadota bacterium]